MWLGGIGAIAAKNSEGPEASGELDGSELFGGHCGSGGVDVSGGIGAPASMRALRHPLLAFFQPTVAAMHSRSYLFASARQKKHLIQRKMMAPELMMNKMIVMISLGVIVHWGNLRPWRWLSVAFRSRP